MMRTQAGTAVARSMMYRLQTTGQRLGVLLSLTMPVRLPRQQATQRLQWRKLASRSAALRIHITAHGSHVNTTVKNGLHSAHQPPGHLAAHVNGLQCTV
jgi:hypothetical protein